MFRPALVPMIPFAVPNCEYPEQKTVCRCSDTVSVLLGSGKYASLVLFVLLLTLSRSRQRLAMFLQGCDLAYQLHFL